jgi:hypothetical protein
MTPKEKAIHLVDNFFKKTHPYYDVEDAKQCALIAVDEIMKELITVNIEKWYYYQEVKQEIEKL